MLIWAPGQAVLDLNPSSNICCSMILNNSWTCVLSEPCLLSYEIEILIEETLWYPLWELNEIQDVKDLAQFWASDKSSITVDFSTINFSCQWDLGIMSKHSSIIQGLPRKLPYTLCFHHHPQSLPQIHSALLPFSNLFLVSTRWLHWEFSVVAPALVGIWCVVWLTQAGWALHALLLYAIPQGPVEIASIYFIMPRMA